MGKYDKLKNKNQIITNEVKQQASHFKEVSAEYERVSEIYANANVVIKDIDKQFSQATKLTGMDLKFVFFATALQCIRQYFITPFSLRDERPSEKEAAKNSKIIEETLLGKDKGVKTRKHKWYNPSLDEIIGNPVPFDTIQQCEALKGAGIFKGTGKLGHRLTLGHDPILGWVFGTANIATSTLTTWKLQSYHVKKSIVAGKEQDALTQKADTYKVLEYTKDKLINNGKDGKIIIATSLIKEGIHLYSDVNSKNSLPFPIVSTISPDLANKFTDFGLDACNMMTVGKQATYASLINFIIALIHRMLYDEGMGISEILYEARTRKVLTYSNVIASASNILAVAITEGIAALTDNPELAKKGFKYLDVGGLAVTLQRIISDNLFINKIKMEFIEKEWYNVVVGEEYEFMQEEDML